MLLKIDDPVVAHEYWKAGLLVNKDGYPWDLYTNYPEQAYPPQSKSFATELSVAYINIEE